MTTEIRPVSGGPADAEPDTVGTPEGDNEIAPDQPLQPGTDAASGGLQNPRGNEPDEYKNDRK